MSPSLDTVLFQTHQHLLSLRNTAGHWEGELASSALSTATAIVALHGVDASAHQPFIQAGAQWLVSHQNADGGWGDTTLSKSNLSTTLLCWSALHLCSGEAKQATARCETWISQQVGSLAPDTIAKAVIARYGKDKTFSVPILMLCTICGTLGENAWERVLPLPFELAALPRTWFGAVGMPVVSYALPALIAIGHARFKNGPRQFWNPQHWLRVALWPRIRPMLKSLQPSSGGYLEATPLTSFVTMALAAAGEKRHPCIPRAVEFLQSSMRPDGSWPIDTNLATWGTTLALKSLPPVTKEASEKDQKNSAIWLQWLGSQQYQHIHPFTNAAPGGWAWTDLPGGVPDADDTAGAIIALHLWNKDNPSALEQAKRGITWLLDLQNRDGGIPTFCRGWGTLPFDRSTPELTAHALLSWWLWEDRLEPSQQSRIREATTAAFKYLSNTQRNDHSWIPLWFGNEHTHDEENPVYGTAQVVAYLSGSPALAQQARTFIDSGRLYLKQAQKTDGSWGGDAISKSSIEETAVALNALALQKDTSPDVLTRAVDWLISATQNGTQFPASPIGLYFARLWYHEKLYPIVWTLQALRRVKAVLSYVEEPGTTPQP
jgi:squalene-hopene/tetraprenyl-beta-curcumene cyclase